MRTGEPLGFALVGLGLVGPAHARSLKELDDASLAVVCDIDETRARETAAEYGCDWSTDFDAVLKRDDVQVVNITTPQFTHRDLGMRAAAAGKHVVVEKPIEINSERARQLIEACEAHKVKLAVIFQSRCKKAYRVLKDAVDAGKLGRLIMGDAYVKWFRPQEYYNSSPWRGTWEREGGGALINQTSHNIDALQWIMGPIESLYAQCRTTHLHDIEVEDLGVATVSFRNGAVGVIVGATALKPGLPERVEIHGEKGTVILEGGGIKLWQVDGMDEEAVKAAAAEPIGTGASDPMAFPIAWHKAQLQNMIDAIRQDTTPIVDGHEGLKALKIIEAIYESSRSGKPVRFDD